MFTYMPTIKSVKRKWYIIDAKDRPLGRVAAQAATLLRGKHKPTFAPHVDCGDYVIIINCSKAVLTGKKLENKCRYRHTGYIGHIKVTHYKDLMANKPEKAMELAIKGMLPNNTLGRKQALRIHLFAESDHNNQAQQPKIWSMDQIDKEAVK